MSAYATEPKTQLADDGRTYEATSTIESWKGDRRHLRDLAEVALDATQRGPSQSFNATVALSDGTQKAFSSSEELYQGLGDLRLSDITTVRIEVGGGTDGPRAVIVARRQRMPGFFITVTGADRFVVTGLSDLLYERARRGYVDRLGSWRWMLGVLAAFTPFLLVGFLTEDPPWWAWGPVLLATFVILLYVFPLVQVRTPLFLEVEPEPGPPFGERLSRAIGRVLSNRIINRTLGIAGLLLLAVIGNRLAELIRWP